ncbi:hypothetical protein [Micromonospora arborensis]|uniref:hypothetical protein n=1 Tax=Micromonospora arborensis TaxID=2116518 RepID=UPI00371C7606
MRIQVLNLPDELVDGTYVNRFALIIDEHPDAPSAVDRKQIGDDWDEFAREIGGKGAFVTQARVCIDEPTATAEMVTEIVHELDGIISRRLDEHVAVRNEFHVHPSGMTMSRLNALAERARQRRDER